MNFENQEHEYPTLKDAIPKYLDFESYVQKNNK